MGRGQGENGTGQVAPRAPKEYRSHLAGGFHNPDGDLSYPRQQLNEASEYKRGTHGQLAKQDEAILDAWQHGMSEEEIVNITGRPLDEVRGAVYSETLAEGRDDGQAMASEYA